MSGDYTDHYNIRIGVGDSVICGLGEDGLLERPGEAYLGRQQPNRQIQPGGR